MLGNPGLQLHYGKHVVSFLNYMAISGTNALALMLWTAPALAIRCPIDREVCFLQTTNIPSNSSYKIVLHVLISTRRSKLPPPLIEQLFSIVALQWPLPSFQHRG